MARLFTTGFETQKQTTDETMHGEANAAGLLADHVGFTAFDTATKRTGNASYLAGPGAYFQVHNVVTTFGRAYFHRCYYRFDDITPAIAFDFLVQRMGAGDAVSIRLNTNGTVTAHNSAGTQIGSASAALTASTWYRVELRVMFPSGATSTAGQVRLRINGTDIVNVTNANLGTHSSLANGHVLMGHTDNVVSGVAVNMDDVAINDSTGASQTGFPGSGRVLLSKPVSDSAIGITWKNSVTGGLWTSVDNTPPTGEPHPEEPPPPPAGAHGTNQTHLWCGIESIIGRDQDAWFDAGFTTISYMGRSIIGGSAVNYDWTFRELETNTQGHDFSDCYAGFWLDTDAAGPPLHSSWFSSTWTTSVFAKLDPWIDRMMGIGFKGFTFDAELYFPNTNQPYGWEWDYEAGHTEASVRAQVRQRGQQFAERIIQQAGDVPCQQYHYAFPGDTHYIGASVPHQASVDDGVYGDWLQGLVDGGLNMQLLDSNFFKDFGGYAGSVTNANDWAAAFNRECDTMELEWSEELANRQTPMMWLTDGPLAVKAEQQGLSDANIWDRQRSDAHLTAQVTGCRNAARNPTKNVTIYGHNLRGDEDQYIAMPGFPWD